MANNYVTVSSWGRTYHLDSWVCARWLDAKRSLGVLESRWSITSSPCWKPAHCLCCLCCLCWTLPTPHPHPHKRDKSARNCSTGSKSEKVQKVRKKLMPLLRHAQSQKVPKAHTRGAEVPKICSSWPEKRKITLFTDFFTETLLIHSHFTAMQSDTQMTQQVVEDDP